MFLPCVCHHHEIIDIYGCARESSNDLTDDPLARGSRLEETKTGDGVEQALGVINEEISLAL